MKKCSKKLAVVGLGYVGLPLAIEFSKKLQVIGFDVNKKKIRKYINGEDPTCEVGNEVVASSDIEFTSDSTKLKDVDYIIIAVPTPIHCDKTPDLSLIIDASKIVGKKIKKGSIVIFESTVYPGVTEDVCVPILEKESGMKCKKDFFVGYSPERINPGDKVHRLVNIKKIVSGIDENTLKQISDLYRLIIDAGVHEVKSIKVAEAAKLVENAQRDINIAFMNEISMVFDRMDISTSEVINAMNTKWNSLGFYPGLVGGHCIGVDPYYFVYQAEKIGYHSQIISAGRKINDDMPFYIVQNIIKQMILSDLKIKNSNIYFMGITFKPNCPDTRNSKTLEIIDILKDYDMKINICEPQAEKSEVELYTDILPIQISDIRDADCIVFSVAHDEFRELSINKIKRMFSFKEGRKPVLIDIHSIFDKQLIQNCNINYWSL